MRWSPPAAVLRSTDNGKSQPEDVLKYLTWYLTGDPISDRRLISDDGDGVVTFWARGKEKSSGNKPEPFPLRGREFVCRPAMYILPKGYTRSRSYGGYHGAKRGDYLARCRALLKITPDEPTNTSDAIEALEESMPMCARCEIPMVCIEQQSRPSWKQIFEREIYADRRLYSPMHHIQYGLTPAYPIDEYG